MKKELPNPPALRTIIDTAYLTIEYMNRSDFRECRAQIGSHDHAWSKKCNIISLPLNLLISLNHSN